MQTLNKLSYPVKLLKANLYALIFAFLLLLLFSVVIYYTGASDALLRAVNVAIRLLAVGFCVLKSVETSGGIVKGAIAGFTCSVILQLAFSLITGTFKWKNFLIGIVFSVIFGIIFGIIFTNLKNKGESS